MHIASFGLTLHDRRPHIIEGAEGAKDCFENLSDALLASHRVFVVCLRALSRERSVKNAFLTLVTGIIEMITIPFAIIGAILAALSSSRSKLYSIRKEDLSFARSMYEMSPAHEKPLVARLIHAGIRAHLFHSSSRQKAGSLLERCLRMCYTPKKLEVRKGIFVDCNLPKGCQNIQDFESIAEDLSAQEEIMKKAKEFLSSQERSGPGLFLEDTEKTGKAYTAETIPFDIFLLASGVEDIYTSRKPCIFIQETDASSKPTITQKLPASLASLCYYLLEEKVPKKEVAWLKESCLRFVNTAW